MYRVELPAFSIQAEAEGALGTVESTWIMIGCIQCGYETAIKSCIVGYH